MRSSLRAAAVAANAAFVFASPTTVSEPCAQVSALLATNPPTNSGGSPIVDIDLAYACLKSVPVDKAGDLQQLNGYKTLANFQSDLVYLKDPTPGWLYQGVDFQGSLDGIISKVQKGVYDSEYDVQFDLWSLVTSAHDFHLTFSSDILNVFNWWRAGNLVSVSNDGSSLPSVYDSSEVFILAGLNSSSYTPSPVVSINDTDVEQWLNEYAAFNPWDHDPDANYNNIFISIAVEGVPKFGTGARFSQYFYHFPGSVTTLKFANGTTKDVQSYATVNQDFTGVTNGESFFRKFCTGPSPSASASASGSVAPSRSIAPSLVPSASGSIVPRAAVSGSSSAPSGSAPAPSGSATVAVLSSSVTTNNLYTAVATASLKPALPFFPAPIAKAEDNSIAGFLPEDLPDTAVITMPTFWPRDDYTFQNVFRALLATAKSAGRTKLIIDVRGNNGGSIKDAYGVFKELFPSMNPWAGGNMAAWPLCYAMGGIISELPAQDLGTFVDNYGALTAFWDYEDLKLPDGAPYPSWSDFYGPVVHHGGKFTNIRHYNFSSIHNGVGLPVYGYANDTKPQPQTFTADNIVILSDGACGSTCAIFAELMKTQAGVQFITVGGRKQYGPSQPVGGSKGSNDQPLKDLAEVALFAYQNGNAQEKALFKPYLDLQQDATQFINRVPGGANVNFQNNIRKGDDSGTPLMFVYEASNCRFFYTAEMLVDQSKVWSYTYSLQWGNGTCLKDSTGAPSAATGFSTSYFNSAPPANAKNFFGADIKWSYPGAYSLGEHHKSTPSSSASASSGPGSTGSPSPPPKTSKGAAASLRTPFKLGEARGVLGAIVASMLFGFVSVLLM